MFVNGSFWDNQTKVIQELQMEGHRQDYIDLYMSYMKMLKSTYNLVAKGKTFFDSNIPVNYINIFLHQRQLILHCTYSIFNILETIIFSNNKKDKNSFSFMLCFGYFYYLHLHYHQYYLLILFFKIFS